MHRRNFLRSLSLAGLGGLSMRGFSRPLLMPLFGEGAQDRVLVIVQLYGGNDGLNTVIPLDQYDVLSALRGNVLIPEGQVLSLGGASGATGLHPALGGLRELWDQDKLAIVQGVGYPSPVLSHFRSTDIWETGANSDQLLSSGWVGRYLHAEYPNYPVDYPNSTMPDPLAVRIGAPISAGLQYNGVSMGTSIYNTLDPFDLAANAYVDPAAANCCGDKLDFIRTIQRQTDLYGDAISAASVPGCNLSTLYPTGSEPGAGLAYSLQIVARLICGGSKTRIYWVSADGFDTHSQQVDANDHTLGKHARLLQGLGDSLLAFQDDLQLLGIADRVMGMTFSEFGRRIMSTSSNGTDHGTAAPMFLFGNSVLPGILGTNPDIDPSSNAGTNVAMQYDFRSVYASVLKNWFCLGDSDVDSVLLDTYQPLDLIDPSGCIALSVHEANQGAGTSIMDVYPNPFTQKTTISFTSTGGRVLLQITDEQGRLITTLKNESLKAGSYTVPCDLGDRAAGIYYCRLQNESRQQVRNMLKVR
jgi:uncharacterized protein (DUF1501 family)